MSDCFCRSSSMMCDYATWNFHYQHEISKASLDDKDAWGSVVGLYKRGVFFFFFFKREEDEGSVFIGVVKKNSKGEWIGKYEGCNLQLSNFRLESSEIKL